MKKNTLLILFILLFQLPILFPLIKPGIFYSHDDFQVQRINEYFTSVIHGYFPSRWSAGLNYGYGYPLFIFYAPGVYMYGSLLVFLGASAVTAVKILFGVAFILGPLGMYLYAKKHVGAVAAFLVSIVFTYAPYRATDAYVRGALPELIAFSIIPWILYFIDASVRVKKITTDKIFLAIFIFLLVITHHISTIIFALFVVVYSAYILATEGIHTFLESFVTPLFIPFFLGIGMSCFYWLPLIIESRFVHTQTLLNFNASFFLLELSKLWNSSWGFGGAAVPDEMSLQIGKHILIFSLVSCITYIWQTSRQKKIFTFWLIVFIFFTFFETVFSRPVWSSFAFLNILRIPWRFHIITTIAGAVLSGFGFRVIWKSREKYTVFTYAVLIVFVALSIGLNIRYFHTNGNHEDEWYHPTTTWDNEYMPIWVTITPSEKPSDFVSTADTRLKISDIRQTYNSYIFSIDSPDSTKATLQSFYYPGWIAATSDGSLDVTADTNGLMQVSVPEGKHRVTVTFTNTPWRTASDVISLSAIGILAYLVFFSL